MTKDRKLQSNRMEKAVRFSQIYGIQKENIQEMIGADSAKRLTAQFLNNFPKAIYLTGLRKMKSRAMYEAMVNGTHEKGNHKITYAIEEPYTFQFYYRGTLIVEWNMLHDEERAIHAGDFEDTKSTMNQRREISYSIENFKEAVERL